MITVGLRQLKNSLGEYMRKVRNGETLVVTDRGVPVAKIIPAGIPDGLAQLMAEGRVTWSGKPFVPPPDPIKPRPGAPLVSDAVIEDRG